MKFINDEWLEKRAQESIKKGTKSCPSLIGALKNEIESLNKRVINLNTFKGHFFSLQEELIAEKEKNKILKRTVHQQRIGEPVDDSDYQKIDNEYFDDTSDDAISSDSSATSHPPIVCIPDDDNELITTNDDLEQAKDLILLSLTITNEYNLLIENLLETAEAESYQDLIQYLLDALQEFNLHGAVQIRSKFGVTTDSNDKEMTDEYSSLIDHFKSEGLQYQHEDFYIFNKPNISLLIGGLPDESQMSGRYMDYIKHVVTASNNKIRALDNQRHLNNQHKNLKSLVEGTHTSITQIQQASEEQASNVKNVFNSMGKELSNYLGSIDLSKNDKKQVLNFVATNRDKMTDTLAECISLDEKFVGVINQLKHSFTK